MKKNYFLVALMFLLTSFAVRLNAQVVTLGGTGNSGSGDIKMTVNGGGNFQVRYNGGNQIFDSTEDSPNGGSNVPGTIQGIVLAIGNTYWSFGSLGNDYASYNAAATIDGFTYKGDVMGTGNPSSGTTTSAVKSGNTYTMTHTIPKNGETYTFIVKYVYDTNITTTQVTATYTVIPPSNNAEEIKMAHVWDSYLGSSDTGPGEYLGTRGVPGEVVSVFRGCQKYQGFQYISGTPWSGHYSALYSSIQNPLANDMTFDGNQNGGIIDTNSNTDNGVGISINFGTPTSSVNSVNQLIFAPDNSDIKLTGTTISNACPAQTVTRDDLMGLVATSSIPFAEFYTTATPDDSSIANLEADKVTFPITSTTTVYAKTTVGNQCVYGNAKAITVTVGKCIVANGEVISLNPGETSTISVLNNDTINGATATPTNVTVAPVSTLPTGITLGSDGKITTTSSATPGTYSVEYKVCDINDATNCKTATANVVVLAQCPNGTTTLIDWAHQNAGTPGQMQYQPFVSGQNPSIYDETGSFTTTSCSGDQTTMTLNFDRTSGTTDGIAGLDYKIQQNTDATSTFTLTFSKPVVIRDLVIADIDKAGYHDKLVFSASNNGTNVPVNLIGNSYVEVIGQTVKAKENIDLGEVAVQTASPITEISFVFTSLTNGSQQFILIKGGFSFCCPPPVVVAENDSVSVPQGETSTTTVLENDKAANNVQATTSNVNIGIVTPATPQNAGDPVPTIDTTTGKVTVPAGTSIGTYTIEYQICDGTYSGACDTATVTVKVLPVATVKSDASPICSGPDATFTITGTPNATVSYNYTIGGGTPTTGTKVLDANGKNQIPIPTTNGAGDIVVNLTKVESGAYVNDPISSSDTTVVNQTPYFTAGSNFNVVSNGAICYNTTAEFAITYPVNAGIPTGSVVHYTLNGTAKQGTFTVDGSNLKVTETVPNATETQEIVVSKIVSPEGCTLNHTTQTVGVFVYPQGVGGTITSATPVCSGTNSTTLTLSGHTGDVVRWESSTDNFATVTPITNTTATYTSENLMETTKYRAIVKSGATCDEKISAITEVTVKPLPITSETTINVVAGNDIVNATEKASGVTVSGTGVNGDVITVTWGGTVKTVTVASGTWSVDYTSAQVPTDGSTQVTAKATRNDCEGAETTRPVTVDTGLPNIVCKTGAVLTKSTDATKNYYTVVGTELDATTTETGATITNSLTNSATIAGQQLTIGQHTITWTVTTTAGNTNTCETVITVKDTEAPVFTKDCTAIGNQTKEVDTGGLTYTHNNTDWDVTATDNSGVAPIISYALTGDTTGTGLSTINGVVFNLGTTTVTATVKDGAGNTITCTYTVTVQDTTDPVFTKDCTAIGNQVVTLELGKTEYTHGDNTWHIVATDNSGVAPVITYDLSGVTTATGLSTLNGQVFNKGVTIVKAIVTDKSGNKIDCTYTVTVLDRVIPVDPTVNPDPLPGYVRVTFAEGTQGSLEAGAKDTVGKFAFDVVKDAAYSELEGYKPEVINVTSGYTYDTFNDVADGSGNDYPTDLTTLITTNKDYTAQYNKNIIPVDPDINPDPAPGYVRVVFNQGDHGTLTEGTKDTEGKFAFDVLKDVTVDFTGYEPTINPNNGYSIATDKWVPVIKTQYSANDTHVAQYTPNTDTAYKVEHYKQNTADATYPTTPTEVENLMGTTDTTVTAVAKTYDGFTVDYTVTGTVKEGIVAGDGSLVLKLYYKDTKAPDNTTTTLVIDDVTADNIINGAEAGQDIPVTGTVTGEFKDGDVVTLTVNGKDFTGNVKADGTFSIIVPGSDLAADPDTTIDGKVAATDAAGNVGEVTGIKEYGVDTDVNGGVAPTVIITEDANNDGFINKEELSADNLVDVKVEFNSDKVEVGDTVTVWVDGSTDTPKEIVVTAADKANGFITTDFPSTGHGTTMTVKATIKDNAGNVTPEGEDSAKIDTSDLSGVAIEITSDANNDGFLNKAEFGDGTAIATKVTLPADAVAGDELLVTLTGASPKTITLSDGQITAGVVEVIFDGSSNGDGSVIKATAQVTDAAQNKSNIAEDKATVNFTKLGAPTVTIAEDNNPDDEWLNKEELNGATEVTAEVGLPTGTVAGDKVVVSDNAGNEHTITVTDADVTAGKVSQKFPAPAEGNEIIVEAYVINALGNPSETVTDKARVDTSDLNGLTLVITTDSDNDNIINKAELEADVNKVKVEIGLPGNAVAGDMIKITMTGNSDINRALTPAEITAGKINVEYPAGANGTDMIATAQVTDAAQNKSNEATDNAVINTSEPGAPTVEITQDANNDGYINASEKGTDVAVKITPPATAQVGDTLSVTDNAGNTFTKVLATEDLTNGVTTTFPNPAEQGEIVVEAHVVNQAGTPGPKGDDSAVLDTTDLSGVTVEITTDANNDTLISNDELGADVGKVNVKVGLPATAEAGDKLEVTMTDNTTYETTLTAADIAAKEVVVAFNPAAEGIKMITTAKVTDVAGNVSNEPTDSATIDTQKPSAPTVMIAEDNNPDDGYINKAELGTATELTIKVGVPVDAVAGDTIEVTDNFGNKKEITLTQADVDSKEVTTTLPVPQHGEEIVVIAQAIDQAGNKSDTAQDSAKMDLTEFIGLAIDITEDENNDGFISAAEFKDNDIDVRVIVPQGAEEGDIITITGSSNTDKQVTLTQADITTGYIDVKFATAPVDNTDFIATATINDVAGNSAGPVEDKAIMQLSAPKNPIVVIEDDKNNDGYVNAEELDTNGDGVVSPEEAKYINVSVTLPEKVAVGDTLEVDRNNDGTFDHIHTLTAEDVAKGGVSIPEVANPGDGNTLTVTAVVKDQAGNPSEPGTDSATIDTTAPSAPEVVINDGGDGYLNADEIAAGVTATITPPADAQPGDELKVDTDGDGIPEFTKKLTQDDITNGVTVDIPAEDIPNKGTLTVDATVTDPAGNESPKGTDSSETDNEVPNGGDAPVVEITTDKNNDGFINKEEMDADGVIKVKVSFDGTKVDEGDTVLVVDRTDPSNPVTKEVPVTATDRTNGYITTEFDKPAEGSNIVVTSTIKDPAGNESKEGQDTAKLDTSDLTADGGVSIVIVEDTNNDGLISKDELGTSTTLTSKVTLPKNAVAGDKLVVTGTGNGDQEVTLTQSQVDAGTVDVTFDAPGNGTEFVTTAKVTDPAGNESNLAEDKATMMLNEPGAPTVDITQDANNDNFINASEKGADVAVKVTVPSDTKVGDKLTITDNAGNTHEVPVTQEVLDNGAEVTFPNPAEGEEIVVEAIVTDPAGNESPKGDDRAVLDTSDLITGLGIEITTDVDNNELISTEELANSNDKLAVKVTLPEGADVGDTLTITGSGNTPQVVTLTQEQVDAGIVETTFNPLSDGADFVTTATIKDKAGNEGGPVEDKATMQLTAPGTPIVTIREDNNPDDGFINAEELGDPKATELHIDVAVPATAVAGDTMNIDTNGDGTPDDTKVLTLEDIQNGSVTFMTSTPGEGEEIKATAWVTDKAGNQGPKESDSAIIDTTAPGAPTVEIQDGGDDKLNKAEVDAGVTVKVTPPADAKPGDTLSVDTNGDGTPDVTKVLTQEDIDNGVIVDVPAEDIPEEGTLTVDATVTDPAGNESPKGTDSSEVDQVAPSKPTVVINDGGDDILNKDEVDAGVTVTVTPPADAQPGDTLNVDTDGDGTPDVTKVLIQEDIDNGVTVDVPAKDIPEEGTLKVDATITDSAGNESPKGTDSSEVVKASPTAPTVEIQDGGDGIINKDETPVKVTIGLPTGTEPGDTLNVDTDGDGVSDVTKVLTQDDIDKGVEITVPDEDVVDGGTLKVDATVTDKAGNVGDTGSDTSEVDITAPGAPVVKILTGDDDIIDVDEKADGVKVKITLPVDAEEGDVLKIDTDGDGQPDIERVLTADDITNKTIEVEVPSEDVIFDKSLTVDATITDQAGNVSDKGTDTVDVVEQGVGGVCLTVYNEFSPNGDGIGDTFFIECIKTFKKSRLEVFNRWGNTVYVANNYQNDWTGIASHGSRGVVNKGEELPEGTYFYVLDLGDGSPVKKGWLYINR